MEYSLKSLQKMIFHCSHKDYLHVHKSNALAFEKSCFQHTKHWSLNHTTLPELCRRDDVSQKCNLLLNSYGFNWEQRHIWKHKVNQKGWRRVFLLLFLLYCLVCKSLALFVPIPMWRSQKMSSSEVSYSVERRMHIWTQCESVLPLTLLAAMSCECSRTNTSHTWKCLLVADDSWQPLNLDEPCCRGDSAFENVVNWQSYMCLVI